ncbi:LLM class flavin-dependent oxidoreductase [Microbacterium yannicii]|uniref:LLM class flavin-dependent oxidoreductase n=1 Tax=Microbacterium yannicii TaxID=671622 RepID=UPI000304B588|nr:LLM class flavin-dependent oxidoreductase [Microbacterium yannicii]
MHFSLFLGQMVSRAEHDTQAIDLGIEQAHYADAHGFSAVYAGEQHFNNYEPYADGFMMAAYLAGQLEHAYLGLSVVPLIIHHPLFIAERANLLDQLTKGRSILGMSAGRPHEGGAWHKAGIASDLRQSLFDAKLDVLERAWAHEPGDPPLEFDTGDEHGAMVGRLMPRSYRTGHPLYAIGTNTPSKVADAGRHGRFVHFGPFALEPLTAIADVYRNSLAEGGATPAQIDAAMQWAIYTKLVLVGETDEEAWRLMEDALAGPLQAPPWVQLRPGEEGMSVRELAAQDPGTFAPAMGMPESMSAFLQRIAIVGSPETVAREVARYGDAGLPHMHIRFAFGSEADPDIYRRSLELFATEVMPRVGSTRIDGPAADEIRPEFRPTELATR